MAGTRRSLADEVSAELGRCQAYAEAASFNFTRKLLKPSRRSVASVWWRSNSAFAKPYRKIDPPSLRRHDDVIPLAFAQEQMFAVKQLFQ